MLVPVNPSLPVPAHDDLSQNPAAVYLAKLAPNSRRTMLHGLDVIAQAVSGGQCMALPIRTADGAFYPGLDWSQWRYAHSAAIRTVLAEKYEHTSANVYLTALRRTLKEARRLGLMSGDDYQSASDIENIKGESIPAGRDMSKEEFDSLFRVCHDGTLWGIRDAAIFAVMRFGLRRSEVSNLKLSHYKKGELTIRRGKGRKDRKVYIADWAQALLNRWLEKRGTEGTALFTRIRKGEQLVPGHLSDQAIYFILKKRCEEAGLDADITPHSARRGAVGDLLDAGADSLTVASIMGHASVNTTQRYNRRINRQKKAAANLIAAPEK